MTLPCWKDWKRLLISSSVRSKLRLSWVGGGKEGESVAGRLPGPNWVDLQIQSPLPTAVTPSVYGPQR